MFNIFRKKKVLFKCPICEGDYSLKIDPTKFTNYDYQYRHEASIITRDKCQFCKAEMTVVIFKSGKIKAYDDKWEKYSAEYDAKTDALGNQIGELEDILEENPNDDEAKNKLEKLQKQYDKVEKSFEVKDEKYEERKSRWYEKREDKFGG